jgi:LmbE family N-acetylglucosaminyl deacetylase
VTLDAMTTVLHVAPHPDDESLGAPCTLLRLADAGARVVVVACGLGRPADHARRRAELAAAVATARFELVVRDPPAALGSTDDLAAARAALTPWLVELIDAHAADLVVGPHLRDAHPAHEAVAAAIRDAIPATRRPPVWWSWGIWADPPVPTLLVPATVRDVDRALAMLACHGGELARNDYADLLLATRRVAAVRGVERVLGFGSGALPGVRHAELLTELGRVDGRWRLGVPRVGVEPELPAGWGAGAATLADLISGDAAPETCGTCGAQRDGSDAAALAWGRERDAQGWLRWLCPDCARRHARAIEARLPREWW